LSRAVLKASQGANHEQTLKIQPEHLAGDLGSALYVHPAPEYESPAQAQPQAQDQEVLSFRDEVKSFQIRLIQSALDRNDGNWSAAARQLDMHRSNLHNLATRLGIRDKKDSS
jgi:anaerobic nitric oxide reductase transcription regulator